MQGRTSPWMYLLMNSLTVISLWDHSSSVYLEPSSTGTVRQPAISWIYCTLLENTCRHCHHHCSRLRDPVVNVHHIGPHSSLGGHLTTWCSALRKQ